MHSLKFDKYISGILREISGADIDDKLSLQRLITDPISSQLIKQKNSEKVVAILLSNNKKFDGLDGLPQ